MSLKNESNKQWAKKMQRADTARVSHTKAALPDGGDDNVSDDSALAAYTTSLDSATPQETEYPRQFYRDDLVGDQPYVPYEFDEREHHEHIEHDASDDEPERSHRHLLGNKAARRLNSIITDSDLEPARNQEKLALAADSEEGVRRRVRKKRDRDESGHAR